MSERRIPNISRIASILGVLVTGLGLTSCDTNATPQTEIPGAAIPSAGVGASDNEPLPEASSAPQGTRLPLRIPLSAVMTGAVNSASYGIFQAATDVEDISDQAWLEIGSAAIALVGAATLITLPGTGPDDVLWTEDPEWLRFSADMQSASLDIGRAASTRDPVLLSVSAARLAQSCQSCHLVFSPRLVTSQPAPE